LAVGLTVGLTVGRGVEGFTCVWRGVGCKVGRVTGVDGRSGVTSGTGVGSGVGVGVGDSTAAF
jgi:hypothetical protein